MTAQHENEIGDVVRSARVDYETKFQTPAGFQPKKNLYICSKFSRHQIVTIERAFGSIPYSLWCTTCKSLGFSNLAYSQNYQFEKLTFPDRRPTLEFYRPNYDEFQALPKTDQNFIWKGGLLVRRISK